MLVPVADASWSRKMAKIKGEMIFKSILRDEGATAFMKGWTASYLRIGPHTGISFILIEKVRQLFGMKTYYGTFV